jgi:outer membrane protein assembly factor BamE (lipoprotein component of BamABCDE complex)
MMRSFIVFGMLLIIFSVNNGCSVYKAFNLPDKKDVDLFSVGTPRENIIAEFGPPINTETQDGKKIDIYKFVQGYSKGAKGIRTFFHTGADVVTLGLWEVVGTPVENAYSGDEMAFKVTFDENNKVLEVTPLNDESNEELTGEIKAKPQEKECGYGMDFCE